MEENNSEKNENLNYIELEDVGHSHYYTTRDESNYKKPFSARRFIKTNFRWIYICGFMIIFCILCAGIYSGMIVGIVYSVKYFLVIANRDYMKNRRTVILISIDSFRYDYFQIYPNSFPNIKEYIIIHGVQLKQLQPVFPTKTFPNHYAIATGLLPVHNGMVLNTMWDPNFQSLFRITNNQVTNSSWYDGEPIWVTCEKQKVITNAFFWPGSEVKIKGILPSEYLKYDGSMPYKKRIEYIVNALKKDRNERPNLILGYFEGVDHAAHMYGPNSVEVEEAIKEVDDAIGILFEGLIEQQIEDLIDIFIVSDHGMTLLSEEKRINIDKIIDMSIVHIYNFGPIVGVWPRVESQKEEIYNTLKNSSLLNEHASLYYREDIPPHFHLSSGKYSRRVAPIFILAEVGWSIVTSDYTIMKGDHGYSNDVDDMQGILVTRGPHVKDRGGEILEDSFENIHLYPLLAEILQVEPAEVDGSLEKSRILLR